MLMPFNFQKWIDENKDKFKPPVNAHPVYFESGDFVIMVVGGPNKRTDYHINQTEEFFYQLKGDMVLPIRNQKGEFEDVHIKEGEIFLLPAEIPHSPQRYADTIGLVIERRRAPENIDKLLWYCDCCKAVVHQFEFHCEGLDLGGLLKPLIEQYYESDELRHCVKCGYTNKVPT